jgi:excisionase family DNA binding protein
MHPLQFRDVRDDVLISTRRAAEILHVSPRTIRRMAESEQLPATTVGGQWRLSKAYVLSLLPVPNQRPE